MTVSDTIESGEGYMIEKLPKGMTRSCMLDVAELLNEHARGDIGQLDSEGAVRVFNAIVGHLRPGDELPNGLRALDPEQVERAAIEAAGCCATAAGIADYMRRAMLSASRPEGDKEAGDE